MKKTKKKKATPVYFWPEPAAVSDYEYWCLQPRLLMAKVAEAKKEAPKSDGK